MKTHIHLYTTKPKAKLGAGISFTTYAVVKGFQFLIMFVCFFLAFKGIAQQNKLDPQNRLTSTAFVNGSFVGLTQAITSPGLSSWSNEARIIDAITSDFGSATIVVSGSATTKVSDLDQTYNGGNFAGFLIENSSLVGASLFNAVSIKTYLNGEPRDQSTSGSVLGVSSSLISGAYEVGFYTKQSFNEIEITFSNPLTLITTYRVYYALMRGYAAGPAIAACNTPVAVNLPTYPVVVNPENTSSGILNRDNAVTASTTDFASFPAIGIGDISIAIKDQVTNYNTLSADKYFVGFDVESSNLLDIGLLGGALKVVSYLDGVRQDSSSNTGNQLLSAGLLSSSRQNLGFVTSKPFDEVKLVISYGLVSLDLGQTNVYNAVFEKYCKGPDLVCNTPTPIVKNASTPFPVLVDFSNTKFSGISVGTISNPENAIDADLTNHADINFTVSILASASFAVKDAFTDYLAGTYAGFDIAIPTVAGVNVLDTYTITTYLDGAQRESVGNAGLLSVPTTLLSANGRKKVGFITTMSFDEVKITITKAGGVSLGATQIYSAIFETFCAGPTLACNTQTIMRNGLGGFPVYINGANTSSNAACVGCTVSNTDNAIDNDASTFASLNVLVAAVGAGASLSVADALTDYPSGTYVGFDIENQYLLGANAFSGITISTYLNGNATAVESKTGNSSLIAVSSSLLTETGRQTIGFVTSAPFDEVRITLSGLAAAQILNPTKVYSAIIQKSCAATIACNNTYWLNSGSGTNSFPVVIDGALTGFTGLACVGCAVENAGNAVTPSTSDYATIKVLVGAAAPGSLAVRDAVSTYPIGTFAGFAIRDLTGVVDVDLFKSLTISTFKKGVLREAKSASNLIDLKVLIPILGSGTGSYNIGFVTSFDFDEIRITANALVGVGLLNNEIRVFGAFVDTRTSSGTGSGGTLNCGVTLNPDFNATLVNVPLSGNVSTNDKLSGTVSYGTPVPSASNPAGASIVMNTDGSYTFSATTAGTYSYNVPVCPSGVSTNCPTAPLVITVNNPTVNTNPPVANTDIASVVAGTGANVVVKTLANDACSNAGCTLNPALTVTTAPLHGATSVNATTGDITYTPTVGFTGTDSLTYTVCDMQSPTPKCATAKQYFTVLPAGVANTTVAADDYLQIATNTAGTGNVKTNDNDPEGSAQTVTAQPSTTIAGKGTLILAADGSYTFTPVSGFTGPVEFTYTTCDNATTQACASATLHILVVNMAPNAVDDHIGTPINAAVSGNLKTNDTDPAGSPLTYNATPTVAPLNGTVSSIIPGTGQFIYTPAPGFVGVDSFKYTVCNAAAYCSTAWAYISVTPGYNPGGNNNSPIAQNDYNQTFTAQPVNGNAKNNDIEPDGDPLTYTVVNNPAHGTLLLNSNGTYTYTPTAGYNGADTAKYQVCDNRGLCTTALIVVKVSPDANGATNDMPDANDDVKSTPMSVAVSGNVLDNDTDPNGNPLTATLMGAPATGNLVFGPNGSYTYTPPAGFVGTVAVPYSACDGAGACDMATLVIVVQPVLIPDLVPIITVLPTTQYGVTNFIAIANVYENNGVSTTSSIPIQIYISKNSIIKFSFNPVDTTVSGTLMHNSAWTVDSVSSSIYYIFTTNTTVAASGRLSFVINGTLRPLEGTGRLNVTETIFPGSGGEVKNDNNFNAGTITFFPR